MSKTKERFETLRNRDRKKSYIEERASQIANECSVNEAFEEYYKLGLSNAYGSVLYMLDKDFDRCDIKKFILDECKDDAQFRCDVFGVWAELYNKIK